MRQTEGDLTTEVEDVTMEGRSCSDEEEVMSQGM